MCREIFGQVVTRITRRLDRCVIVEQARFVLRRLAAEKPVEVFEAIGDWPMVERPCRTGFVWRRVVPLAERDSAVAIVFQHFCDRCAAARNRAGIRSEEGRVGKEWGSTGGSRWWP